MKRYAFTLAEVLITLAIIGVVAAISIPSVISNSQQLEFKTGLRKAVSVLNSAISMSMALDGETPYDNANLFGYLMRHMAVIESTSRLTKYYSATGSVRDTGEKGINSNAVFYTNDGMRFEFGRFAGSTRAQRLYENPKVQACVHTAFTGRMEWEGWNGPQTMDACDGCGSYGLNNNVDNTTKPPCLILVDVNGDRKPSPKNVNCKRNECADDNSYKFSDPDGKKLSDIFSIMITDREAIPYGVAAQKAMYNSQK